MLIGDAHCTKKITGTLKKHRSKECVVFIFKQSVVICEKVSSDQEFLEAQIDYWISFHVSGKIPIAYLQKWILNFLLFIVKTIIKPSSKNEVILFCKTHSDWFKLCFYRKKYELIYSSPDIIFSLPRTLISTVFRPHFLK